MLPDWLKKRAAGVHLHPTSLPGGHGIGNLGNNAYEWIDFLADAGFSYWQMCPVGPTGFGDSPYQVFSSSAGNPYFIDLQPLISNGYLPQFEAAKLHPSSPNLVDYGTLYDSFFPILRKAYQNFMHSPQQMENEYGSIDAFEELHRDWLHPFAKYQAIKANNHLKPWWEWTNKDKNSPDSPLSQTSLHEYKFQVFLQYLFRAQWNQLHQYAKSKKIALIGDLPIYVAPDSSDTWCDRDLFQINQSGDFEAFAGVPPDYFNNEGQFWGNPLYEWEKMQSDGYNWWINRIQNQLELFEVLRIDHFRAFHDFWSIPEGSSSARFGTWEKGPGLKFWDKIKTVFPHLPFLAEDLGDISEEVRKLRTSIGLPGMAVLQFAFDGNPKNCYLPHNLSKDLVLYAGTHDNDTSCGWYQSTDEGTRSFFRRYLNIDGTAPSWDMLRLAYRSISQLVIITAQDLLSLGSEARFNTPGELQGNWNWRMTDEQFNHLRNHSTDYLREQALLADRFEADLNTHGNEKS